MPLGDLTPRTRFAHAAGKPVQVFLDDPNNGVQAVPQYPVAGTHVVKISKGDVVELVVQNNNANAFNGDYRPNGAARSAQEQHPFHLHGHHFWVSGWNAATPMRAAKPLRIAATDVWVMSPHAVPGQRRWQLHC